MAYAVYDQPSEEADPPVKIHIKNHIQVCTRKKMSSRSTRSFQTAWLLSVVCIHTHTSHHFGSGLATKDRGGLHLPSRPQTRSGTQLTKNDTTSDGERPNGVTWLTKLNYMILTWMTMRNYMILTWLTKLNDIIITWLMKLNYMIVT